METDLGKNLKTDILNIKKKPTAQSAGAVEYTSCISAEG